MMSELTKVDQVNKELEVRGYIKGNYLNIKRLIHITGVSS